MNALADSPKLVFQTVPEGCEHVYHLMAARYDGHSRDDLMALLYEEFNLKCIVQYWPLYRSELFRNHGFGAALVPETDRYYDSMISFPWWSGILYRGIAFRHWD